MVVRFCPLFYQTIFIFLFILYFHAGVTKRSQAQKRSGKFGWIARYQPLLYLELPYLLPFTDVFYISFVASL